MGGCLRHFSFRLDAVEVDVAEAGSERSVTLARLDGYVLSGSPRWSPEDRSDALDSVNGELARFCDVLSHRGRVLTCAPRIRSMMSGRSIRYGSPVAILSDLVVPSAFRGRGFGLGLLSHVFACELEGCDYALLNAYPMQWGCERLGLPEDGQARWLRDRDFADLKGDLNAGKKKLAALYASVGFKKIPKHPGYMMVDLTANHEDAWSEAIDAMQVSVD